MARPRSPGYPNMPLPEALTRVGKVFDADRRNPIDREVVAKHIGYSGLSGAADQAISALMHYDLLERVGKGEVRVSQLAVDILHPDEPAQMRQALYRAATSPTLFKTLKERFPDNRFSDSALRSFLIRLGFVDRAVDPVIRAYSDTCRYLEQAGATESGGEVDQTEPESVGSDEHAPAPGTPQKPPTAPPAKNQEMNLMAEERILTTGLLSKDANFRLIVNGRVGVKEIDMLIRKLEIDKEILADADDAQEDRES